MPLTSKYLTLRKIRNKLLGLGDAIYLMLPHQNKCENLTNFIIIGAMKSGTTSLYEYLDMHPDIFMTHIKEPSYFLDDNEWRERYPHIKSKNDLCKLMFKGYKNQLNIGEASITYTCADTIKSNVPYNIFQHNPNTKLVYILRNPFSRIVSHYLHCVERGIYDQTIDLVLDIDHTFLERSLYHYQLRRYLNIFPRNQIKLVIFEEFINNTNTSLKMIFDFLNVDSTLVGTMNFKQSNKTIVNVNTRKVNSKISLDTYNKLIDPIKNDISELENILGRKLNQWDISQEKWCV